MASSCIHADAADAMVTAATAVHAKAAIALTVKAADATSIKPKRPKHEDCNSHIELEHQGLS